MSFHEQQCQQPCVPPPCLQKTQEPCQTKAEEVCLPPCQDPCQEKFPVQVQEVCLPQCQELKQENCPQQGLDPCPPPCQDQCPLQVVEPCQELSQTKCVEVCAQQVQETCLPPGKGKDVIRIRVVQAGLLSSFFAFFSLVKLKCRIKLILRLVSDFTCALSSPPPNHLLPVR
ncbi:hypothetical protein MC885_019499 [Smutsia gigantea]|nr:hypothetical protein MC885_019499 [Smutsia gigantea]